MDSSKKHDNPSPEADASLVSKLFFWWILPFFKHGYNHDLQVADLYNSSKTDQSEYWGNVLEKEWYAEVERSKRKRRQPRLETALRKAFIKPYSFFGVILFIQCVVLKMLQPIVLARYIQYFDPRRPFTLDEGWCLGIGVVVMAFLNIIIMHYVSIGTQRIGMQCRVACSSLVYRKLLRLNNLSLGKTPAGQLVNLLSNDVSRFDQTPMYLHYIWIMPIQAVIATYVMYQSVGIAALAGMGAITIEAVPIQGYLSRKQGHLRYKIAKRTDYRIKLMNEITSGIQVIKQYAWEQPFEKMVEIARRKEIDVIKITSYIKGVSVALMVYTERFTLYFTVITFVLLGNRLTSDVVFSMAQLFNTVQLYMSIFFPMALALYAEAKVSIKRLQEFLVQGENARASPTIIDPGRLGLVEIIKAKASWVENPIVETLTDINLSIRPGTLCIIVGQVGSGKSSLLQLLLKELPLTSGRLDVSGIVSYASQEPWLFGSSVRNNILFGQPFSKVLYYNVVKACALEKDFEQLPHGDRTLVTERGVSLSGGQRARINLARAVYRQADIYLFDDPLSAVDAHVGEHLFNECLNKYLKNKTRILTTHQLQFLKKADMIVIMNNGQIEKIGTFKELSENELKHLRQNSVSENVQEKTPEIDERPRLLSIVSHNSTLPEDEEAEPQETEELMEKGALSTSVYVGYMKAGGMLLVVFLVFMLLIAQIVTNASDLWLTYWTNMEELKYVQQLNNTQLKYASEEIFNNSTSMESPDSFLLLADNSTETALDDNTTFALNNETFIRSLQNESISESPTIQTFSHSTNYYIIIYTALIASCIVLLSARSVLFYNICMRASKGLHDTMFNNVLQATMRFFHTNSSGRILNRFSKDMGAVDELLPKALLDALQVFLVMSGILVMVFIVNPWMIIPTIITALLFYYIRVIYLASAQDVKRLEGITKAPVYSHLNSSLQGISTIRCSNAQTMVSKEFDVLQDQHTGAWFLFLASSEAFGFYMDFISVIYLAIVTFQFLIFDYGSTVSGYVGLVISQSLILTGMTQYGVRQSAEAASQMTSTERILQYTRLDKEGPFESLPAKKPHRDWPERGKIEFQRVYLKYVADEAPVLKNLSFVISGGEKVGIVGRTGAGKSSLISALFRLAPIEGTILIDELDTLQIGLHDLRRNISIIPQEPVLFSASIRYNLDPFEKCDDATLWKALDNVELRNAVQSLDQEVTEGGSNFSAGQRQLICLARAIIRNNKVLIMDEATANVDPQTDALIQATIRTNFKDCTVLTIAHRLNTVMDSDKIIVMDGGEMVEFEHPHLLLQNREGHLSKMVETTGSEMESKLRAISEEAYKSKTKDDGEGDKKSE